MAAEDITVKSLGGKLIAGAIAGLIGVSATFPLDVTKTRLQNQVVEPGKPPMYRGFGRGLVTIVRNEGFALYGGLRANMYGIMPEKAIKLAVNDVVRAYLHRRYAPDSPMLPIWAGMTAGACAGAIQQVVTIPMEGVKIRMQLQMEMVKKGMPAKSMSTIVRELGLRGLYVGSAASIARDVPFSIIYFPMYGWLKDKMRDSHGNVGFMRVLTASTVAGGAAAWAVTPVDVVKTRIQAPVAPGQEPWVGMINSGRIIVKQEGMPALFKGAVPRILTLAPLFGIALFFFEIQKKLVLGQSV